MNIDLKDKFKKLTETEKRILKEISKGKKPKQIADSNNISTKTVSRHKENIKEKINLENNHELIIFAHELLKLI
jgi:DNA-binding CsgD family transcriptional regulator